MRMARHLPPSLPFSSACCWLVLAKSLLQMIILFRVNKHKEAKMETYIKAVLFYEPKA